MSKGHKVKYVVGCPAWDRGWSLELWFHSVMSNVDPAQAGLVFVVPKDDQYTRDVINEYAKHFAWLVVERDKNEQFDRAKRGEDNTHETLAAARNQILAHVNQAKPEWFLSWDSDLILPPGVVGEIARHRAPISTVWTWLNRQQPQTLRHVNPETGENRVVRWQEPMMATAMAWEGEARPVHHPAHEWRMRARGFWRADVVLAFSMMRQAVYGTTMYQPHRYGEEIPFNWSLHRRNIPRFCYGDRQGVHLYKRDPEELALGWPDICQLEVETPLAATITHPRDSLDEALGFYPLEGKNGRITSSRRGPDGHQTGGEGVRDARPEPRRAQQRPQRDSARADLAGGADEDSRPLARSAA